MLDQFVNSFHVLTPDVLELGTFPEDVKSVASFASTSWVFAQVTVNPSSILESVGWSYTTGDYCVHAAFADIAQLAGLAEEIGIHVVSTMCQEIRSIAAFLTLVLFFAFEVY